MHSDHSRCAHHDQRINQVLHLNVAKGPRRTAKHAEGEETEDEEDEEIPDRISTEDAYLFPIVSLHVSADSDSDLSLVRLVPSS